MLRHKLKLEVANWCIAGAQQSKTTCIRNLSLWLALCMSRCCLLGWARKLSGTLDLWIYWGCQGACMPSGLRSPGEKSQEEEGRHAEDFPRAIGGHHSGDWSSRKGRLAKCFCHLYCPPPTRTPLHTSAKQTSKGIFTPSCPPRIKRWWLNGGPCQLYIGVTWGTLAAAGFCSTPGGFDGDGAGCWGWYPEGGSGRGGADPPTPP